MDRVVPGETNEIGTKTTTVRLSKVSLRYMDDGREGGNRDKFKRNREDCPVRTNTQIHADRQDEWQATL